MTERTEPVNIMGLRGRRPYFGLRPLSCPFFPVITDARRETGGILRHPPGEG